MSLSQKWSKMSIADDVFNVMSQHTDRKWKIDGRLSYPTFDDVDRLLNLIVQDVRKLGYDSIESGGIMVRKDGHKIDVYVHVGELNENSSI
jgi:hypothetical protein